MGAHSRRVARAHFGLHRSERRARIRVAFVDVRRSSQTGWSERAAFRSRSRPDPRVEDQEGLLRSPSPPRSGEAAGQAGGFGTSAEMSRAALRERARAKVVMARERACRGTAEAARSANDARGSPAQTHAKKLNHDAALPRRCRRPPSRKRRRPARRRASARASYGRCCTSTGRHGSAASTSKMSSRVLWGREPPRDDNRRSEGGDEHAREFSPGSASRLVARPKPQARVCRTRKK
jgi:hypothetical protein